MSVIAIEDRFAAAGGKLLVGRTVVQVVYACRDDVRARGWSMRPPLIVLSGGVVLYPSVDAEGNNAGAWFTNHDRLDALPPLPLEEFIPRRSSALRSTFERAPPRRNAEDAETTTA